MSCTRILNRREKTVTIRVYAFSLCLSIMATSDCRPNAIKLSVKSVSGLAKQLSIFGNVKTFLFIVHARA